MAEIDWDNVTAFAPELSDVALTAQADILSYVNEELNVERLGGEDSVKLKLARVNLAAHLGTLALPNRAGAHGPTIMEMEGPVMRQYTAGSGLEETAYGRAFRSIVRNSAARGPFVA